MAKATTKRTICSKKVVGVQAVEEGQCDYSEQTQATNDYNDALRSEETACSNVEVAEAALTDAQAAYDAAAASYDAAKANTDAAKAVLDETYDSKRP